MASQDDFLDGLLKDIKLQDDELAAMDELGALDIDSFLGVEDTQDMSQDEIEKVLNENQEIAVSAQQTASSEEISQAVDEGIMALLQEAEDEVALLDEASLEEDADIQDTIAAIEDVPETKKSKAELKAEKVAARKAKKAARKQAKKEKKANENGAFAETINKEAVDAEAVSEASQNEFADLDELLSLAGNSIQASEEQVIPNVDKDSLIDGIVAEKKEQKKAEKKTLFSRIVDFLMEEEEEEEKENENILLSEENKTVIEELDKNKKKKKSRKDKKKGDVKEAAEDEESEGEEKAKKTKKEKKDKKAKKEEPLTEEIFEQEKNKGTKISRKNVIPIALVCLSFGIIVILVAGLSGDYSAKKTAREAFYEEDYETVYQNFYGKELNQSEQVMYSKAESILRIRLWLREYEMFVEEGAEAEALDSLIQSVKDYPVLYDYALQWNAGADVAGLYGKITDTLASKYQLTEAQALQIAGLEDDMEYSRMIYAIVDGEGYGSLEQTGAEEELEDLLPEEEELGNLSFVDSNK